MCVVENLTNKQICLRRISTSRFASSKPWFRSAKSAYKALRNLPVEQSEILFERSSSAGCERDKSLKGQVFSYDASSGFVGLIR